MADRGSIGYGYVMGYGWARDANRIPCGHFTSMGWGASLMVQGSKLNSDGHAAPPCLQMTMGGRHAFRWAVKAGTRTLEVWVKNVGGLTPYPTLTIRKNPTIGVNADVVGTASAGTSWQKIGPITVSPSSDGVLVVELEAIRLTNNVKDVRWDDLLTDSGLGNRFELWDGQNVVLDLIDAGLGVAPRAISHNMRGGFVK